MTNKSKELSNTDKINIARRTYQADYRRKNRDKIRAYHKEWRSKNKDKVKATNKRYWLSKYNDLQAKDTKGGEYDN